MTYQVTEPHPSAAPSSRIHTGRGGAGNTYLTPSIPSCNSTSRTASLTHIPTTASTAASNPRTSTSTTSTTSSSTSSQLPPTTTSTRNKFSSGRGGIGNIRPITKAALYDLDAELELQRTREERAVGSGSAGWHVGRGGAGNCATSESGSRKGSQGSQGSVKSGFFGRLWV